MFVFMTEDYFSSLHVHCNPVYLSPHGHQHSELGQIDQTGITVVNTAVNINGLSISIDFYCENLMAFDK
jgi:hypothetical protein